MMNYEIWGNSLITWGISMLYIWGAFGIVKLLSMFDRKVIAPLIERTGNRLDNVIYYALIAPVKFAIILLGFWLAIHRLVYPDSFVKVIDNAYRILIILDITWVFVRLTGGLLRLYGSNEQQTRRMMPVIRRAIFVVLWTIGIITALSNIGVNISALLGTLGIGGIAFALAAQDTVKNIFGAFTIFTDKPFAIGDTIRIDNFEGAVIDVGVRSTRIINYDNRIITIPNYRITDASIINISSEPMRRITVKVGIDPGTTSKKMSNALEILRNLPQLVNGLSDNPAHTSVNFSEFTESALIITGYYNVLKEEDILKVTSDMNIAILGILNRAGMELANPTHILYVHQEQPEAREEERNRIFSETTFNPR